MVALRLALLLAVATACGGGQTDAARPDPAPDRDPVPPAPTARILDADTVIKTTSGATFTASKGWKVEQSTEQVILTGPEGDITLVHVEVAGDSRDAAIAAAWAVARPGFDLKVVDAQDLPAREGWQAVAQVVYFTPASEARVVVAVARRAGSTWYVTLIDGKQAGLGRRGAQIETAIESLKVSGVERESFAGRKAHTLDAARLAALDAFVEEARTAARVPGAAVAVVQGGKLVHAKGFGVRKLGGKQKVTPDTLFMIGSVTKSLTTLMMARLIDEGRFTWDTPATQVLPSFALGDPAITSATLMRHTVCACTGMPRQDYEMIFEGKVSPEDRIASMKTMKPTTGLGETFQYSNLMVSAGGFAAAHARAPKAKIGPAYDKAMQELVLAPLGMKRSTLDFRKVARSDHALPHPTDLRGQPSSVPILTEAWVEPVRPAGGVWSSARDMSRYILLELGKGKLGGKQVVSEANLLARRQPQIKITDDASYGLAVGIARQNQIATIGHDGGTAGFQATVVMLPDHDVGLVLLSNSSGSGAFLGGVQRRFLEILFDGKEEARENLAARLALQQKSLDEEWKLIQADPDPAWFDPLIGAWQADGLGRIELRREKGVAMLDAGEWKVRVGKKTDRDGTLLLVTTSAPLAGIPLIPRDEGGKTTLVLDTGQQVYTFRRTK
jgi:CubicO group peptidase (beta-lactamase class C family)